MEIPISKDHTPLVRQLWPILLISSSYFIFGKLGLLLAIPPGFATSIWPSSGIALAGLLLCGRRAWPGVFLGSLLLNFSIAFDVSSSSALIQSLLVATSIGSGAALQAVVGSWLIQRSVAWPTALEQEEDIFRVIAWGSASCLVNATIGTAVLFTAGFVSSAASLKTFGTWWVGDAIGVIIFTPIVIMLLLPSIQMSRRRKALVLLPLTLLMAVVVSIFVYAQDVEHLAIKKDVERKLDERRQSLEASFNKLSMYMHAINTFYQSSDFVSRIEFHTFVRYMITDHENIAAIGWVPRVRASERTAFENLARKDGLQDFEIWQKGPDGKLMHADGKAEYFPSYYIESYELRRNLGFDLSSDPIRQQFLTKAVDSGKLVVSQRIRLISDPDGAYAIAFYQPVFIKGKPIETTAQRREALQGFAVSAVRVTATIKAALGNLDEDGLSIKVDDLGAPAGEQLLFDSGSTTRDVDGPMTARATVTFGERTWKLTAVALPSLLGRSGWTLWVVLIGGAIFTGLLGALLLIISGRNDVVLRLVESRTEDLRKSEERFELASTGAKVGIWDIDLASRDLHWSPIVFSIFGIQEGTGLDKLEELRQRIHPDDLATSMQARDFHLSQPNNKPYVVEYRVRQEDGNCVWVQVRGQAIWKDGSPTRMSGTVIDITERKAVEEALKNSKIEALKLLAMIETAPDFVGMADMNGNILYHNDAANKLIGLKNPVELQTLRTSDFHPAWVNNLIQEQAIPVILEKGVWRGETAVLHSDGHEIPVSQIITLFRDDMGSPVCTTTLMQDITDRRTSELLLKEKEAAEQFQLLANSLPQLAWMADTTGWIHWYNERWYAYTGTTQADMEGWGWQSVHHPDHLDQVMTEWQAAIASGAPFEMVFPLKGADGAFRPFLTRVDPVKDEAGQVVRWYGTNTDITAQEMALKSANDSFKLIMENIPDLIFVKDAQFRIVNGNKAFLEIFPESQRDGVIGTTMIESFSKAEADLFLRNDREAFETGTSETVEVIKFPNGKLGQVFTKKVRFYDAAGEPFILGVARDITAMRESEMQRVQLMEKLTESNTELERFAYVASHDMQEPLRMIANFSHLIMEEYNGKLGEAGQVYLSLISGAATRMQAMVADLLEYARVGSDAARFVTVDANKEFTHMVDNLLKTIREQGARVTSDPLPFFRGNPVQIMRLLQNLVGNGLKYQAPGGNPAVHVSAEDAGAVWKISVRDNGIGMQAKHIHQIFEPFKRLHSWQQYQGTGIGLAVCKKIVENHGGTITATSEVGVGSVFVFTIPKHTEEAL